MTARRGNEVEENITKIHSRIQVIPIITTSIASTEKKTKTKPKSTSSQTYKCALSLQNLISLKQLKFCLVVKFSPQKLNQHTY